MNASSEHRGTDMTHRIEILHTSILFGFPINAIVVLILFVVYPPTSPINLVQLLRGLWSYSHPLHSWARFRPLANLESVDTW